MSVGVCVCVFVCVCVCVQLRANAFNLLCSFGVLLIEQVCLCVIV